MSGVGIFNLAPFVVAIVAITAAVTLAVAGVLYYFGREADRQIRPHNRVSRLTLTAVVVHLVGGALVLVALMTWWTSVNWGYIDDHGTPTGLLVFLGSAASLLVAGFAPPVSKYDF